MPPNSQSNSTNIEYYRKLKKLTQEDLANLLGITRPFVAQLERGTKNPSIPLLNGMADIFGVTIDELVGRDVARGKKISPIKRDACKR